MADQPQYVKVAQFETGSSVPASAQITGMALTNSEAASVRCMCRDATRAPRSIQALSSLSAGVPDQGASSTTNTVKQRAARLACHSTNLLKRNNYHLPIRDISHHPRQHHLSPGRHCLEHSL